MGTGEGKARKRHPKCRDHLMTNTLTLKFSSRACKADAVIVSFYYGKQEAHAFVDFMYNGKCHRARKY